MAFTNSPKEILIVGAGVFGLSTTIAFLEKSHYDNSNITIIDSSQTLPNPLGSSVDASRIIRADYANPSYAKLACLAQSHWRDQSSTGWGGQGRYTQTGFVLTGEQGQEAYVLEAMRNVQDLARQGLPMELDKIQKLDNHSDIRKATGLVGVSGETGYANWNSGWADAEACVAFAIQRIKSHPKNRGRVSIRPNTKITRLTFSPNTKQCTGVQLTNDSTISADLTILATGAWTPSIFDLSNRALATGQALAFVKLTQQEQDYLVNTPVTMNFARGTFIIAPHPQTHELKIARHGFGYRNPLSVSYASSKPSSATLSSEIKSTAFAEAQVSVPRTDTQIPIEAEKPLRDALVELFPPHIDASTKPASYPESLRDISKRPFTNTRLCWYTDTPSGNFIFDFPPLPTNTANKSLFIATGGSGHGFKFFPILGNYIVDAMEGKLEKEYEAMWAWPTEKDLRNDLGTMTDAHSGSRISISRTPDVKEFLECEDGSRGGPRGMILEQELRRGVVKVKEPRRGQSSMTPKL